MSDDANRLIEQQKERILELENTVAKQQAQITDFINGVAREMHAEDAAPHDLLDNALFHPTWNPQARRWTGAEGDK